MNKLRACTILFLGMICLHTLSGGIAAESEEQKEPGKRKTGRALVEFGALMAVSGINYQIKYTKFIEDWQFEWNWRDQKKRFFTFQANRLDSNSFKSNWTHGLSGAVYYNWARTNNLDSRASFLFSLGGSLFWEYVCEWREVISINDNLFTAFGGPALGEPLFQFGHYFQSKNGAVNRLLGAFFDPVLLINNILDGKFFRRLHQPESGPWRRFRLYAGRREGSGAAPSESYPQTHLALDLQLVTLRGFGQPGETTGFEKDTLASDLYFDISFSGRGVEEFSGRCKAVLFGFTHKKIAESSGGRRGYCLFLGAASAFDILKKRKLADYDTHSAALSDPRMPRPRPTQFTDKLGVISLIGPSFDVSWFSGKWFLRFSADAFFDFALANSLPYNDYTAVPENDLDHVKTTLLGWGYYYGFGFTFLPQLTLTWGPLELRADLKYQRYRSIQGLDRFQDEVSDDFPQVDSWLQARMRLSAAIPGTPLSLSFALESQGRHGRIKDLERSNREMRWYYQLGVRF